LAERVGDRVALLGLEENGCGLEALKACKVECLQAFYARRAGEESLDVRGGAPLRLVELARVDALVFVVAALVDDELSLKGELSDRVLGDVLVDLEQRGGVRLQTF